MVIPLLEAEYAFSQVVGHLLVAMNQTSGPPATYYIGDTADDPSSQNQQQSPNHGPALTPVVTIGDQSAGIQLESDGTFDVFVGGHLVATASLASALGSSVQNGSSSVTAGTFPVAGETAYTFLGPIADMAPDNVYMMTNPIPPGMGPRHLMYTVAGTAAPSTDSEYPHDLATDPSVTPYFDWVGVDYPAATFPMGPSVNTGIQNLVSLIASNPGTFAISGYSQGAIVTCRVWRDYILNPDGQLHDRLNDIVAHVTWGNPLRCPGKANGNGLVSPPIELPARDGVVTGGIAGPDDLTPWQTPDWHIDFAHDGDLYADCPTGLDPWSNEEPAGADETAIYNMVQGTITGRDSLLLTIGELLTNPIGEMIPLIEAMINGIQFLADMNTHNDYTETMQPAARWLSQRGQSVPARTS
jgi:hypothetical protein